MSVERPATRLWREAFAQVDALLQRAERDRDHVLADLAHSQPQLHAIVASLLDAAQEVEHDAFMEPGESRRGAALEAGALVGSHRIVRRIGAGGMGEVWLAERDDGLYEGEVAIKTLHPYFAGGALRERFLREAQLLGKLTHPNIARLLDAGVSSNGIVYLVLEYVRGVSIDAWCDERRLDVGARLRLFMEVCTAVAHAHARLIVHRDIKPSNILVTDEGSAKLLDFGVAKIIESDTFAESAELTRLTGRMFTPEYAAPEQILGQTITTATDVYALGVLLHVLLTSTRPYSGSERVELERAILHEDPVRASRAVSAVSEEVLEKHATTRARLQRELAGDLDTIIERALSKDPGGRYPSVLALAEDVRRHLHHEPIVARPGSFATRARKLVRRHRLAAAGVSVIFLAIAAGISGVAWQSRIAQHEAQLATQEAKKAAAVKDFLLDIFNANSTAHPEGARARQTTAEELLDVASAKILGGLDEDPEVRLELMETLGRLNLMLEKYEQTEALQRERVRFATEHFGTDPRTATALIDLGVFLRQRGDYAGARRNVEEAIAILDEAGERSSVLRGRATANLAQIAYMQSDGRDSAPIDHYLEAIRILERFEPSDVLVNATLGLARSYELAGRYDEAIATNQRGIELATTVGGPRYIAVGGGNQQLARSLAYVHRLDEAERHLARAIEIFTFAVGAENGLTTMARLDVGRLMNLRGKYAEAVDELEQVLLIRTKVDGPTNHWVQQTRYSLAEALFASGNLDRARNLLDEALEIAAADPKQNVRVLMLRTRAALAREQQRPADALRDLELALQIATDLHEPRSQRTASLQVSRAETLIALGRAGEARGILADAAQVLAETETDPRKPDQLTVQLAVAAADLAQRRAAAAQRSLVTLLEDLRTLPRADELWLLEERAQSRLAESLFALGRTIDGCRALDAAIAIRRGKSRGTDARLIATEDLRRTHRCATPALQDV